MRTGARRRPPVIAMAGFASPAAPAHLARSPRARTPAAHEARPTPAVHGTTIAIATPVAAMAVTAPSAVAIAAPAPPAVAIAAVAIAPVAIAAAMAPLGFRHERSLGFSEGQGAGAERGGGGRTGKSQITADDREDHRGQSQDTHGDYLLFDASPAGASARRTFSEPLHWPKRDDIPSKMNGKQQKAW